MIDNNLTIDTKFGERSVNNEINE